MDIHTFTLEQLADIDTYLFSPRLAKDFARIGGTEWNEADLERYFRGIYHKRGLSTVGLYGDHKDDAEFISILLAVLIERREKSTTLRPEKT